MKPGVSFSITRTDIPVAPSPPVLTPTTYVSARIPLVMNIFEPLTMKWSPFLTALVFKLATSDPPEGSVIARAAIFSPLTTGGINFSFCSSVPKDCINGIAILCDKRLAETPPHPWANSSAVTMP